MKLNPLKEVIAGKRLVVVDDSIVRGNTQRALVRMLREAGASQVHVRISSPPVEWPCFYDAGLREDPQPPVDDRDDGEVAVPLAAHAQGPPGAGVHHLPEVGRTLRDRKSVV